jgi:acyl-CoA reductase-like NAD-dependent aldehyde dehydrogenase
LNTGKEVFMDPSHSADRITRIRPAFSPGSGPRSLHKERRDENKTALVIVFLNSGQACAAGTRLLVPKSRLDAVKRAIVDTIPAFPAGDPADPKTAIGPIVNEKQYERVQSYIRKGIAEGAEVLVAARAIRAALVRVTS